MALISEDHLEQQALAWFQEMGYRFVHGPQLAPDGATPECENFRQVVLTGRLRAALTRLNPQVPAAVIESAVTQLASPDVPGLLAANCRFHRWITQGLPITFMDGNREMGIRLKVMGFDDPAANDWLSALRERFQPWRLIAGEQDLDPLGRHRELETVIRGLFHQGRLLEFIRSFCLFEEDQGQVTKKIAAYHQFHAVRAVVERVVAASKPDGDRKGGVVWHTQGAGKSIEMACLAGKLLTDPRLENPTLVMVTDRQNLDGQLFGVFAGVGHLLGETPRQADSRQALRDLLANRPCGGIIFTTIQKFAPNPDEGRFPTLSLRHNIVVICDEAHRSQYGFQGRLDAGTGEIRYGLARALRDALPEATFLAFTGTPVSRNDRDTQAVFGTYVSVYDIQQAVDDGATVPIYYESRLAKLALKKDALPSIDEKVDEIFDGEDHVPTAERAKSRWAALAALVGADPRLKQVAKDLVEHYERRSRIQPGKAMVVVMSRDICVRLYDAIIRLRPHWHNPDHRKGAVKVVMTTSASEARRLQFHHTTNQQKKDLERRFRNPADPLKMVLVRDMWLTGFDAACMATMYVDKPMKGPTLLRQSPGSTGSSKTNRVVWWWTTSALPRN